MGTAKLNQDFLPGTLDMIILRILGRGPNHGHGIAQRIRQISADALSIGEGSLYPALQRLLLNGWVRAEWGLSDSNRRARFYELTKRGRKQLEAERTNFDVLVAAVQRIMESA